MRVHSSLEYPSMSKIDDLATQVQDIARKLGIGKYDISGSSVDETSVQVDRGEPKQVKASNRSSVTVRVWNNQNTVGIASTSDTDPAGLKLALKTAFIRKINQRVVIRLQRQPNINQHLVF